MANGMTRGTEIGVDNPYNDVQNRGGAFIGGEAKYSSRINPPEINKLFVGVRGASPVKPNLVGYNNNNQ